MFSLAMPIYAVEPLPNNLINLKSPFGIILFKRSLNTNLLKLLSHFETQKTVTYCGVASVVMVLNSTEKLPPNDSQHLPYQYFTQDDFFNDQVKKIITSEIVQKKGITLMKLNKVIQLYGLKSRLYYANKLNIYEFRNIIKSAILKQQFVIVNFLRSELNQKGGGHHSPLTAYDEQTDSFLILDVARYKYPAFWVKAETLWKAINTKVGDASRGFIVIDS